MKFSLNKYVYLAYLLIFIKACGWAGMREKSMIIILLLIKCSQLASVFTVPVSKSTSKIQPGYFHNLCVWLSSTGGQGRCPSEAVCPCGDFCPLPKFGPKAIEKLEITIVCEKCHASGRLTCQIAQSPIFPVGE